MPDVVLAHCWTGGPEQGWYPSFRSALEADGWRVRIPALPDSDTPSPAAWLQAFAAAAVPAHRDLVLAGHSLGCATVLAHLQALPEAARIGGVVLVAGFSRPLGIAAIDPFHALPFDWKRLKARPEPKVVILGSEDPYLRARLAAEIEHFEQALGAIVTVVPGAGHFSPASGCLQLPQAVHAVRRCLQG